MFIGSINRYMRAVLEPTAGRWKGRPVYVACSGNFTVDRFLDALTAAKVSAGVKNAATAFGLLMDVVERHALPPSHV